MDTSIESRTFIQTKVFERQWRDLGLNDEDLRRLEIEIMCHPESAPIMTGTGGLRKMRFAYEGRGKSGSTRVCYVDFVVYQTVYLITAYPKNKKANLNTSEKNDVKKIITAIEKQLREKFRGGKNE